jgi:hypothetical protein
VSIRPHYRRTPEDRKALRDRVWMLRDILGDQEVGLRGYDAICGYLNALGVESERGAPITEKTLRSWIDKRGFPRLTTNYRRGIFTTNFLILAWMWARVGFCDRRSRR